MSLDMKHQPTKKIGMHIVKCGCKQGVWHKQLALCQRLLFRQLKRIADVNIKAPRHINNTAGKRANHLSRNTRNYLIDFGLEMMNLSHMLCHGDSGISTKRSIVWKDRFPKIHSIIWTLHSPAKVVILKWTTSSMHRS